MLEEKKELVQRGLIITDDIAIDPILDFDLFHNAIVNIVKNSSPKFTIGIFGDWGTGKTTLMNSIYKTLQRDEGLIIVRFEASLQREQFALVSLLKTIAFALPGDDQFQDLKQKLERSAINLLKKTPYILSSIISKYVTEEDEITQEMFDSFKKEFDSKIEVLAKIDRDTLYFDGFEDIKNEIKKIRLNNSAFRIIIFVDDLDICSPSKTLEILESIRIFLGIEGFIYIIGLSHDIISKLSHIENKASSIKGEHYIKKLIQIPINLPKWSNQDVVKLVKDFVKKGLIHDKYKDIITQNIDLISTAIENNPREIKRFLNNFIVACEIFSKKNLVKDYIFSNKKDFEPKELLVIQAIQLRWNKFYNILIKSDESFYRILHEYLQMDDKTRFKKLDLAEVKKDGGDLMVWKVLRYFKTDWELWDFLVKNDDTLKHMKDWEIYRSAVEVGIGSTTPKSLNYEAFKLLWGGKINEFNDKRATEFKILSLRDADLRDADLRDADLRDADLRDADLMGANLGGADLDGVDLMGANLGGADLMGTNLGGARLVGVDMGGADLMGARLWGANLVNTHLWGANLWGAHLVGARLVGANLGGANLGGANLGGARLVDVDLGGADLGQTELTNSIIIKPNYESLKLNEYTRFNNAVIDDAEFIDYIHQFTRNVPGKIRNKKKLRRELTKKGVGEENMNDLLSISKLTEE